MGNRIFRRPASPASAAVLALSALLLAGCPALEEGDGLKGCTLELRTNFCVTLNGSKEIPDDIRVVRQRGAVADTLDGSHVIPEGWQGMHCLQEARGASVLRVLRGDRVLAEKYVGPVPDVDGCHSADTTVDIDF